MLNNLDNSEDYFRRYLQNFLAELHVLVRTLNANNDDNERKLCGISENSSEN